MARGRIPHYGPIDREPAWKATVSPADEEIERRTAIYPDEARRAWLAARLLRWANERREREGER